MSRTRRILLIDDDPAILVMFERMLERNGYETVSTKSGLEGLELARAGNVSIAVIDVLLDDIDGITICQRLRSDPATEHIGVLLLSGEAIAPADQAGGLDAGADGFLLKPVQLQTFLAHIRAIIRMKETEQRLSATIQQLHSAQAELEQKNQALHREIEERGWMQRELEKQNAFWHTVLESLDHPFYVIDTRSHDIVMANSAATSVAAPGGKCYQIAGRTGAPCAERGLECAMNRVRQTRRPAVIEHTLVDADGQRRCQEIHAHPVTDAAGTITQIIEYWFDITERKAIEQELQRHRQRLESLVDQRTAALEKEIEKQLEIQRVLRESEERFRRLFDTITDALVVIDEKGCIFDVNDATCAMLGYPKSELLGKPMAKIHPPGEMKRLKKTFEPPLSSPSRHLGEVLFRHKSGELIPTDGSGATIVFKDTECVVGSFRNITARKKSEAQIKHYQERLEQLVSERTEELKQSNERLAAELAASSALANLGNALIAEHASIEAISGQVLESARTITRSPHGFVASIDPDTGEMIGHTLTNAHTAGCHMKQSERPFALQRGPNGAYPGLWGVSLNTREPFATDAPAAHASANGLPAGHIAITTLLTVPAISEGELVGEIALANAENPYTERDIEIIQRLANLYALAIQRKRSLDALTASEQRYRTYIDNSPIGVFITNADGAYVEVNEAACRIAGYSREKLLAMQVMDLISPDAANQGEEHFSRLQTEGRSKGEVILKREDGSVATMLVQAVTLADGKHIGFAVDLTEQKRAEAALAQARDYYLTLFEEFPALIWQAGTEGACVYLNRAWLAFTGCNSCEDPRDALLAAIHPEDAGRFSDAYEKAFRARTPREIEYRVRRCDGEYRWILDFWRPFQDLDGAFAGFIGSGHDITERRNADLRLREAHAQLERKVQERTAALVDSNAKLRQEIADRARAEEALRISEEKFRTLADFTYDWEYWIGPDERMIYISPACERITGYTTAEFYRHPNLINAIVLEEDREKFNNHACLRKSSEADCEIEFRISARSGAIRWIGHSCRRIFDRTGQYQGARVSNRDITEMRRSVIALQQSENRFRQLAENIGEIFFLIDCSQQTFLYISPVAETILGIAVDDLIAEPHRFWESIHPEDRPGAVIAQQTRRCTESINEEFRIIRADGNVRWLRLRSFLIADEIGKPYRVAGIAGDVTLHKEMHAREREHQRQLIQADKMASIGLMVSGVAHEINNPNNLIMLNADVVANTWTEILPLLDAHAAQYPNFLLNGLPYSDMREELPAMLGDISEGARRIERIVHSLKNFARVDQGETDQLVDIETIIESASYFAGSMIKKFTASFSTQCEPGIPAIRGNRQQLEQVLINLIANACQALPSRERAIAVRAALHGDRTRVIITVSDQGDGISAENLERIMDPFFTTKRDSGGTGLGLSVSYSILRAHGGVLTFESEPDKGTTATIELPINAA